MPAQEEVLRHILKLLCCHSRRGILSPPVALRLRQVYIEIPCHQQFGAPGALLERDYNTLYCQGVVGGKVTSHDVPPPLPRRQLEADNVGSEMLLPKSVEETLDIYRLMETEFFSKSIKKEMKSDAVSSNSPDGRPAGYAEITCHKIFDIKMGLTWKA